MESKTIGVISGGSELPYPPDNGSTHYEGCEWKRGHHNCALLKLQSALEERGAAGKLAHSMEADVTDLQCEVNDLRSRLDTIRQLASRDDRAVNFELYFDAILDLVGGRGMASQGSESAVERHEHKWANDSVGPTKCETCGLPAFLSE